MFRQVPLVKKGIKNKLQHHRNIFYSSGCYTVMLFNWELIASNVCRKCVDLRVSHDLLLQGCNERFNPS